MRWLWPLVVVCFVEAGAFKAAPALAGLPVDLTVVFAGLTLLLVVARALRWLPPAVAVVVTGFALLAPPLLWTTASTYGAEKASRFFTLTLLAALAPVVLVRTREDVAPYLWLLTGTGTITVVALIVAPEAVGAYAGAPVSALSGNTIESGRAAGFVVLVCALALMWRAAPWFLLVPLGAAAVYALLQTGSRGPLVATGLGLVATLLLAPDRPRPTRLVVTVGLVATAGVTLFALAPLYARERIQTVAEGRFGGDVATRFELYRLAAGAVADRPLGLGWGGYAGIAPPGIFYPHDLPLEVLAEAGLVCGVLFLGWLGWCLTRVRRGARGFVGGTVFALLLFDLVNALVSGDLNDNRELFFLVGLGLALAAVSVGSPTVAGETADSSPERPRDGVRGG